MTPKEDLRLCFEEAKARGYNWVGVRVRMDGFPTDEIILNERPNFEKKLKYYMESYDDELRLKAAPDKVRIIDFDYNNAHEEVVENLQYCAYLSEYVEVEDADEIAVLKTKEEFLAKMDEWEQGNVNVLSPHVWDFVPKGGHMKCQVNNNMEVEFETVSE